MVRLSKEVSALPHQAGIELSDFHARVWKSDQGGQNSMQEMHGNQTKCMEFQPIKKSSNFWTSILCPGINFSCSKSLWIWWTIDPLILACLKLMTYASFSTKQLLAVLMDGGEPSKEHSCDVFLNYCSTSSSNWVYSDTAQMPIAIWSSGTLTRSKSFGLLFNHLYSL